MNPIIHLQAQSHMMIPMNKKNYPQTHYFEVIKLHIKKLGL